MLSSLLKFVVVLLAVSIGAVVCFINPDPVIVAIPLGEQVRIPLALVMMISFGFGILTMFVQFSVDIFRRTWEVRRLKKKIKSLEVALDSAKASSSSQSSPVNLAPL